MERAPGSPALEMRNVKRALLFVALAAVALLAIVGCSGGASGASGGGSEINVKVSEMQFSPNSFTVTAGQPVKVTVQNTGTVTHDFAVKGMEADTKVEVQAGQTGTKTFTAPKAGTYEIYCTQPGHEASGMKATLTVQ